MSRADSSIRIEQRFAILHTIITDYRLQLTRMETEVVELFVGNQLSAISERIQEKQRIVRLVQNLEQFVAQWETVEQTSINQE